jgi:methylenetetrahydrofolate dehydrogenase (NADP+) / methenyltetrahydrofolate cyclohydrolase
MIIDGKKIAESILTELAGSVRTLKKGGIAPTLAVILVGDDTGSLSYIKQKQKAAERVGVSVIFEHLPKTTTNETLASAITHFNNDPAVHGLIVQRPVPIAGVGETLNTISPSKDVDGFIPHSPFEVPVARAVITLLTHIHTQLAKAQLTKDGFKPWLNSRSIAVIGRGETAGKPIAGTLKSYDCTVSVIHSQTVHPKTILKQATVIISCVGKKDVITKTMITRGVILISVGLSRGKEGKLHGDYETAAIQDIASFYTPTPGGVGPVNVACLMHNLIDATRMTL